MKRNFKKNKGITLVALIITIVVMLILVAVSVNILIKSNLLGIAEKTTTKYKADTENEANMETIEIGGKQYNSIEEYLKTKNNNNNDNTDEKTYTVRFCNYDGTLLQEVNVQEGGTAKYTLEKPTRTTNDSVDTPDIDKLDVVYEFYWWVTNKESNVKADLTNINSNMEVYAYYNEMPGRSVKSVKTISEDGMEFDFITSDLVLPIYTTYAQASFEEVRENSKNLTETLNSTDNIDDYTIRNCIAFKCLDNLATQCSENGTVLVLTVNLNMEQNKNYKIFQCLNKEKNADRWTKLSEDNYLINSDRNIKY